MKNKKLLFAGILAAFLMLAVPFAVVAFDTDDADATSYTEVGNWDQLETAINNSEISAIKFVNNIVYESDTEGEYGLQITRSMEIDGNGYTLSRMTKSGDDWRFVNISGIENGTVTIKGLTIDFAGGNYSRSINVSYSQNITLNIFNTKVSNGTHYPVNITPSCTNVNLIINETELNSEDGDIKGYCALNIWGTGHTITITNSTLVGNNIHPYHEDNSFSTITINSNSSADITIIDSTIKTLSVNDNEQRAVYFSTGSSGSLKISGDSTVEMDAPGYAMIFLNEGIDVDLEGLTLTTTKNENLIYTESDIEFGSGFETDKLLEVSVCSDVNLIGSPNNSFHGLTVESYDEGYYDVVIDGINSVGAGILVSNAGSVNIENCTVSNVDQESVYFGGNIFGIGASNVNSITIVGCDINNVESTVRAGDGSGKDGIGIFLDQIEKEVIIGGQDDTDSNTVVCTGHNAILITSSSADVKIQNNEISDWTSNADKNCGSSSGEFKAGRALRIVATGKTVTISDNVFSKTYSGALVDLGNVAKITGAEYVSFSNNSMSGIGVLETISSEASEVFIDAGTIVVSLTFSKSSESAKYYCYGIKASGTVTIKEDADFILLRGGVLELSEGAALTGTVNGPDGARITFTGIVAGPGGATLTGGSIIAGGMFTSGSVTINTDGNVLDGTFDDVDLTIDDVEVEINDNVVFTNGTTVVLENGAKFTEDPVFEAGTELIIGTGSSAEVIQITETSKVSSAGTVRTGFQLPIFCENGSVSYHGSYVSYITAFVGDKFEDYAYDLFVDPDPGYMMYKWTDENGILLMDSSTLNDGDVLVAVCVPVPEPSGTEVEESSGFDIADHVVLIEAVIAVIILIGFVAYIRKN